MSSVSYMVTFHPLKLVKRAISKDDLGGPVLETVGRNMLKLSWKRNL